MSDPELLAAYLATTWTVDSPTGPLLLRLEESRPASRVLRPSGIVTAYNPASVRVLPEENRRADLHLRDTIETTGLIAWRCTAEGTGADPELWNERGFVLLGTTRETVARLGIAYEQNAVVWIDEEGSSTLVVTRHGFCGFQVGDAIHPPSALTSRFALPILACSYRSG